MPELELLDVFFEAETRWISQVLRLKRLADFAITMAMNKQPRLHQDQRTIRRQASLHDLPLKKHQKGGVANNGASAIPTSLQEFLKRDSLPIKSN